MGVEEIIAKIAKLCQKYAVREAFLFGSRAKGTALERSDIDIAVLGGENFGVLLEDIKQYGKKIYEAASGL